MRDSMKKIKLIIAGVVIETESCFPMFPLSTFKKECLCNFFYKGPSEADIRIKVYVVNKLPEFEKIKKLFITTHFQDNRENWRLMRQGKKLIIKCPLKEKKHIAFFDDSFNIVHIYFLRKSVPHSFMEKNAHIPDDERGCFEKRLFIKKNNGFCWEMSDLIYDFLQILLINYLILFKKDGVFVHASGIKDINNEGLLFSGKSGCGKSTIVRIWHKHSKAMVLNDDRIILRKIGKRFFIYNSPWHGDFSDYFALRIKAVPLTKLFLIGHSPKNSVSRIPERDSFKLLYPNLFLPFWDKRGLENVFSFCDELIKNVPCYKLGFKNNKQVIEFVRNVN